MAIHNRWPKQNIANPLAAIFSAALMLRLTFDLEDQAQRIERAVRKALAKGCRTTDIAESGTQPIGTREMGDAIVAELHGEGCLRAALPAEWPTCGRKAACPRSPIAAARFNRRSPARASPQFGFRNRDAWIF
ncbi:hypothetical protein CYK37_00215 [Mesorhizobium loti]|nr:hypothetical protein CYK37_00215 [Mesorhizobium loti]